MKKEFIFLLLFIAINSITNGMEWEFTSSDSARWCNPKELKSYILTYVAGSKNLSQAIKNLQTVTETNKELHNLAQDVIIDFAR